MLRSCVSFVIKKMRFIIQVKETNEIRYLQNLPKNNGGFDRLFLLEEYKRNATEYKTITEATKEIGKLLIESWIWTIYTIVKVEDIDFVGNRYTPIRDICVEDYE